MRVRRRFFNAPLCDEVALSSQAKVHLDAFSSPPTSSQIKDLSRTGSSDLAARVLYEGLLTSHHGDFVRYLDGLPDGPPVVPAKDVRLLIVPGMFYREHPEVGADGRLGLEIARRFGFEAEIVPLKSTGSVSVNSAILAEWLDREYGSAVWLLSMSKGASDVRHCLQTHRLNDRIHGWVSIAGTPKGSPLVAHKIGNTAGRLFYRTLCKVAGVDYGALEEMTPSHPYWQANDWPPKLEIIHVLPIPLASHVQGMLRSRHRTLLQYGPNDGFVPVTDVLGLPGYIYPVWGCDHFMRIPHLSRLLYRLYHHIAQKTFKEREL